MKSVKKLKYDGDQVTLLANKNPKYHQYFLTMCPTYAFIDRANGKFNTAMGLKKDYAAILSYAYDIDRAVDAFLCNPEADSYETMKSLGIDIDNSIETIRLESEVFERIADPRTRDGAFKKRFEGFLGSL